MTSAARRATFRGLHDSFFVMPNPWDIGSARLLESLGFLALATTSSGHAASIGKKDREVTLDELVDHVSQLAAAVQVPLSVDAEYGFSDDAAGLAETVDRIAEAGAAGMSIEDFSPKTHAIDPIDVATERVAAAAQAARRHGVVLTGRAENLIHGIDDLDDTITRLKAYRDAGADILYAPGLVRLADIERVVKEVAAPINYLNRPNGPSMAELAAAGVSRVSTGGALAKAAYTELTRRAEELLP